MGATHELRTEQRDVDVARHDISVLSCWLGAGALDAEVALLQLGAGDQFGRGGLGFDPARHHHELAIGHVRGRAKVLLDHEHCDSLGHELVHDLDQRVDDGGCKPFRRLVHHHQRAVEEQRPADREHLLLASRQLGPAIATSFGEAGNNSYTASRVQRLPRVPLASIVRCSSTVSDAEQAATLRHIRDAALGDLLRHVVVDSLAVEDDLTRRRPHETHDRVAQRGLAHAVATDDRNGLDADVERDAVEHA